MTAKAWMTVLIACLAGAGDAAARGVAVLDTGADEVVMGNYCELERLHIQSQGDGVSADFSSVDTSTCELGIETTVHVEGSKGVITVADLCGRGGGHIRSVTTEQSSVVAVLVNVYDRCLATQVLSVAGTGEAEDLHVSPNFKTASLRGTIEGVDDDDQPVSIGIDLVWNGVGPRERTVDHQNMGQGGIHTFIYTSSGTIRDAVAAGSVFVEGTDRTPDASAQGTIERNVFHALSVYR